jgi:tetratricopeptide (TPR) repeat protein
VVELTIDQALQQAIEAHKTGQVQEADRFYTAILKAQPKHPDANHNMGVLAVEVGKVQEALPFFKTALLANPNTTQFWLSYIDALIKLEQLADAKAVLDQAKSKGANGDEFDKLGERLREVGQALLDANKKAAKPQPNILDCLKVDQALSLARKKAKISDLGEAKRIYQDILTKFPKNKRAKEGLRSLAFYSHDNKSKIQDPPEYQIKSLINLNSQGQLEQAINQADTLIKKFPNSATVFNIQGAVHKGLGQLDLSVAAYKNALAIKPDYSDAYNNMGITLQEQGKLEEALKAYKKAIVIKPNYAEAYNNMGITLQEQMKLEEALKAYKKAIVIKPNYADAYYNMGSALQQQDKLEEALNAYEKAIAIKPNYAEAYNNMGSTLNESGKLEEAIEAFKKALTIKPNYAEAYNNMGSTLNESGKLEEAIEAFKKAIAIKPNYAEAYNNMSIATLSTSRLQEGIELRRWRWHTKKHQIYSRSFTAREWDGNELAHDKTLLIWAEQGPGDVVIWSSCISHYANMFRKIIIECHPKLVDLLQRSFPNILVRSSKDQSDNSAEDFDFQVPMETLFGYACLAGACTETQSSYLFPDPGRVEHWRKELKNISSRMTIGLSWKSPVITKQRAKNYPALPYWGSMLQKYKSNFTFVNLQSTDYLDDITYLKDNFGCEIIHFADLDLYNNLSDAAALSQALDCSISVATAAATISAAVGTRTIIPTWKQSSWNNILFNSRGPAVKMLTKNTSESWAAVFEEIGTNLKVLNVEY